MSTNNGVAEMEHMTLDMVIAELNKPYTTGDLMQHNKNKIALRDHAERLCAQQKLQNIPISLSASMGSRLGLSSLTDPQKIRQQCDTIFPDHKRERAREKADRLAARTAFQVEQARQANAVVGITGSPTYYTKSGGGSRKHRKRTRKSRKSKKMTRRRR